MCKVVRTEQNRREEKRTKQSRAEDKVQVGVVEDGLSHSSSEKQWTGPSSSTKFFFSLKRGTNTTLCT